jgi:hypothetical protein
VKKYTINLLVSLIVALAFIAGINWFVNPFDIFYSTEIEGFNKYKPALGRYERLSKTYQVKKLKPDYIILGSSRALAIPADYLVPNQMNGFNLALASGSIYEQVRMFQHAHAVNKLKRVIIGIDEQLKSDVQQDFLESRLAVMPDGLTGVGLSRDIVQDIIAGLFSFDALRASLKTIKKQPQAGIEEYLLQDKVERVFNAGGHRQMFWNMEASILSLFEGAGSGSCYEQAYQDQNDDAKARYYFQAMLERAYKDTTDFYVFFSPVHARIYETWCIGGMWGEIENTKRDIVAMVEETAKRFDKKPFPVWDFGGYSSVTTEPVPEKGDRNSLMQGYWEGSHYSRLTAEFVLERMFGGDAAVPDDFGVLLTGENIDEHLRNIYQQHLRYAADNPGVIEEIRSSVRN